MVAEYLDKNYDRFFSSYKTLMMSSNYVTKRQSIKLLGEILLDRANFNVMTRYIAEEGNLKMMMNLLRDKSKNIQFEAFHVFKVSFSCVDPRLIGYPDLREKGVRGEPEEATTNREHPPEKQGQVTSLPEELPQR
jgi:hypothetical protein